MCDIPLMYIKAYARKLPELYGYPGYEIYQTYKYENEDCEWSGYVIVYRNKAGLDGFVVIDFFNPEGHCVSEFAFDCEHFPTVREEYEDQLSEAHFWQLHSERDEWNMNQYMHLADDPDRPFGFVYRNNESDKDAPKIVRGSIMNGNVLVNKDEIMLEEDAFDYSATGRFLDKYTANPSASLVSKPYILDITQKRYACPFVAAIGMLRQEGLTGDWSDADIFRWFWLKTECVPHYNYDEWHGDNYDEWTPVLKDYMKNYMHFNFDGSVYAIAAGCTAKAFEKAMIGQSDSEHKASWLWTNGGAYGSRCETYAGWSLAPDHFKQAVDQNKSSIFLYSRKCYVLETDEAGYDVVKESVSRHAVNVVGYKEAPYWYDKDGEKVQGSTFYAAVCDSWNDDVHRYMDVTNAKYLDSGSYDTQLQVYTIVR